MGTRDPIGAATLTAADTVFLSAHRSIRASGIQARIRVPACDPGFDQAVAQAFAAARAAGQAAPLLIGAIPFDKREPSELLIPQSWQAMPGELGDSQPAATQPLPLCARSIPDKPTFKAGVRQAIANFQHSDIRKAVLSRVCELDFAQPVDVDALCQRLWRQNPSAYRFRLPLHDGAQLIGASPELLLRKEGDAITTFPLAGSAKRQADPEQDRATGARLLESRKDHYEHSLVVEDIHRVLAPYCAELTLPPAPSLLSTAAMWHLGTPIHGRLGEANVSALTLARQLHPTPAVCGFPTERARKLIDLIEPFARGVFSGMVGWCDAEGNGEWVVAIRCATVHQRQVRLFAGAGIVADSSPEAEWAETQAKLCTLFNALGVSPTEPTA